ncbi:uncharacterized protein LOC109819534 isoform X1 [Asparagus officinalis]|uniref:uncharacterized protein LOC109819534 isoform X1 n=1 Tax=Asparagus officinalis TaxID=4686 RepID=UPI00098E18A3|nr:uncharacterized protein LOC109819534 isoform X1 [Asparagus officinalis]
MMASIPNHCSLHLRNSISSTHRRTRSLSSSFGVSSAYRTVRTVTIPHSDLMDRSRDLSAKIEEGLGPDGLGIVSVSDVPDFSFLRQNLLQLSPRVASLPDEVKSSLEDPKSRYNIGWSHGKEKLESGKLDTFKGSFYANPILDVPTTDVSLMQRYASYCRPNKWPITALPELEVAFKALGKVMLDVGLMLAYHCDQYVSKAVPFDEDGGLEQILKRSRCHKGRLLFYFPKQRSQCMEDLGSVSSWCGWHTDHGSLTGLACGMFMRNGVKVSSPDSAAGLYIKARNNEIVKVVFGEDELAFQIGETTEILSGGRLCATPHCVQAPRGEAAIGVDRSSFAMFMQPDWDENLQFPAYIHHHGELIPPNGRLTFGEYCEMLLNKYYHQKF